MKSHLIGAVRGGRDVNTKKVLLAAALVFAVALGGCAGRGSLSDEIDDATGGYKITADDAAKDSSVGALGGGIDIKDGQVLVVNSNLEKGSLQVKLLDAAGETVLDEKASGQNVSSHELESGEYSFSVTCNENGTTGTLLVAPVNENEVDQQN